MSARECSTGKQPDIPTICVFGIQITLSQNREFLGALLSGAALGIFNKLWLDSGQDCECSLALVSDRTSTQEHLALRTRDSRGSQKIRSTVPLRSAPETFGFWLSMLECDLTVPLS
jgi:hypothetical protein